jgi:diguanylate cyclase (GGDEF)-like protein
VGLITALVVVLARPIRFLLDAIHQLEVAYNLALTPAFIILIVVFVFHQQLRRVEVHSRAAAAASAARQALDRAHELERLVTCGQALAGALDLERLRAAVLRYLPPLVEDPDAWILLRVEGDWSVLLGSGSNGGPDDPAVRTLAVHILDSESSSEASFEPLENGDRLYIPLIVGGHSIGILGVRKGPAGLSDGRKRVLEATANLLAIAAKNVELVGELRESSLYDGLTRCANRTPALEMVENELRRARRSKCSTALIMLDLDDFKRINDRFGHLCGDAVLAAVGQALRDALRTSDIKCRFGGEEFLVLLPDTPLTGASKVAETLRSQIDNLAIPWNGNIVRVTASLGLCMALPGELDTLALIGRADVALYRAKAEGRNRVVIVDDRAQAVQAAVQG